MVIVGKPEVGETLTVEVNIAEKRQIHYQWYREMRSIGEENAANTVNQPIEGATGLEYKLKEDDIGSRILVAAIQRDTDGRERSVFSDPTEIVQGTDATHGGHGTGGVDEDANRCNLWWLLLLLAIICAVVWNERRKKNKRDS